MNSPIWVLAKVIKNVMASAAEAEVGSLFMNAQEAVSTRTCLIEMGHPQPPTKMETDNMTAKGILTGTIKQKRPKVIDMRFYWLKDRQEQGQFDITWEPGKHNLADYPTKHHAASHHRIVRGIYLFVPGQSPMNKKECVKILDLLQEPRKMITKSLDARQTESVDGRQTVSLRARAGLAAQGQTGRLARFVAKTSNNRQLTVNGRQTDPRANSNTAGQSI